MQAGFNLAVAPMLRAPGPKQIRLRSRRVAGCIEKLTHPIRNQGC